MSIYQHYRKEEEPFIDQILNWKEQVEQQYIVKNSDFLDPREQYIFKSIIGNDDQFILSFFGGVEGTERKQALLAPYYEVIQKEDFPIDILSASFSAKFVKMEHRDVLGAFYSLGLDRKKLGDLAIDAVNGKVQIMVSSDISDYVIAHFTQIKKANVQFERIEFDQADRVRNDWSEDEATVSSLRLDVLIKHFYRISRNNALELIKKGHVKVNFKVVEDPAFIAEPGDIISCRGKGRSRLNEVSGQTKKQKWRISFSLLEN